MFILSVLKDVIKVAPGSFDSNYSEVLVEEIDKKYANKVINDVGLCITVYDFVEIGEAFLHPSDGISHTEVTFRMVVFQPFIGEVLTGKIISCNENHIRVSVDFLQDILIPSYALQTPSFFDAAERLWVWKYPEGDEQFFMDLKEEIRFRVTKVNYTRVTKTANGVQATTTESSANLSSKPPLDSGESSSSRRRRASSVDLGDDDPRPSAIQILGTINEDGLGITSWWA